MTESRSISWNRLSLEAIVIVASILLAFAIDAWWDDRQQRIEELSILQALHADLLGKRSYLAEKMRFNETILESTRKLQKLAAGGEESANEGAIDRLLADLWWYNDEANWESAPMTQLIAGGSLASIQNRTLAHKLAELQIAIGTIRSVYRTDSYFHQNELTPFLTANTNMSQIVANIEHEPGNPQNLYEFSDIAIGPRHLHSELLANIQFRNLLIAKMELQKDILRYGYAGLDDLLQEVISILEVELGK